MEQEKKDLGIKHGIRMFIKIPGVTHRMLALMHEAVDAQEEINVKGGFKEEARRVKLSRVGTEGTSWTPVIRIADSKQTNDIPSRYTVKLQISLVIPLNIESGGKIESSFLCFVSMQKIQNFFQSVGVLPDADTFVELL